MVKFQMTGQKELVERLKSLDWKVRRSISAKVLREGSKITVNAIRSAAPKKTGRGAKSLGTKIKSYRDSKVTVAISGERMGAKRGGKGEFVGPHFHLIEFGTAERFHTGEKLARATARRLNPGQGGSWIKGILASTGSFGEHSVVKWDRRGKLKFSRIIRNVQQAIRTGQALPRRQAKIAISISKGKRTGRVRPKPFFVKAWRSVIAAVSTAQANRLGREIEAAA